MEVAGRSFENKIFWRVVAKRLPLCGVRKLLLQQAEWMRISADGHDYDMARARLDVPRGPRSASRGYRASPSEC
jgi:hypothetical protein